MSQVLELGLKNPVDNMSQVFLLSQLPSYNNYPDDIMSQVTTLEYYSEIMNK